MLAPAPVRGHIFACLPATFLVAHSSCQYACLPACLVICACGCVKRVFAAIAWEKAKRLGSQQGQAREGEAPWCTQAPRRQQGKSRIRSWLAPVPGAASANAHRTACGTCAAARRGSPAGCSICGWQELIFPAVTHVWVCSVRTVHSGPAKFRGLHGGGSSAWAALPRPSIL